MGLERGWATVRRHPGASLVRMGAGALIGVMIAVVPLVLLSLVASPTDSHIGSARDWVRLAAVVAGLFAAFPGAVTGLFWADRRQGTVIGACCGVPALPATLGVSVVGGALVGALTAVILGRAWPAPPPDRGI